MFLLAAGISVFLVIYIIDLAKRLELFDANNHIKLHVETVSPLGGIAIFSSCWVALFSLGGSYLNEKYDALFAGSFMLFLLGVKDDLVNIPALKRLLFQLAIGCFLCFAGITVKSLPGLVEPLPFWFSSLLTILLMGALVNAYNFIDGVNGLAGGLSFGSSLAFAWLFYQAGAMAEVLASLALAGGILGFWLFNFGKAKIFMGDNGSTFIGLMFCFLSVQSLDPAIRQQLQPAGVSPLFFLALLLIPVADMAKVVLGRLARKTSPFKGDHTHIHHLLGKKGAGHRAICLVLYSWNALVIIFSLLFLPRNFYFALVFLLSMAAIPYFGLGISEMVRKTRKDSSFETSGML